MTLKRELEKIIWRSSLCFLADVDKENTAISELAQTIINKLEIDQTELLNLWAKLWADGKLELMEYEDKHFKVVIDFKTLAKEIAKAKPIKIRGKR